MVEINGDQRGWNKQKGRFIILVPSFERRKLIKKSLRCNVGQSCSIFLIFSNNNKERKRGITLNFDNINLSLNKSLHHSSNLFLLNLFNGNKTSSEHECSKYKITYSRTRLKMGIELISFSFLYIFFFYPSVLFRKNNNINNREK